VWLAVAGGRRLASRFGSAASILVTPALAGQWLLPASAAAAGSISLATVFWTFLKLGSVVFGSGYVLLAFLHDDLVEGLGVISDQQLVDAVTIGQITPGPVFTTATFIGYLIAGTSGAVVATIGMFLPSFVFVPLIDRLLAAIRRWGPGSGPRWTASTWSPSPSWPACPSSSPAPPWSTLSPSPWPSPPWGCCCAGGPTRPG